MTFLKLIKSVLKEITFFRIFMLFLLWGWIEHAEYDYSGREDRINNQHMQTAIKIWLRPHANSFPVSEIIDGSWQQVCVSEEAQEIYALDNKKRHYTRDLGLLPFNFSIAPFSSECIDRNYAVFQKKRGEFFLRKTQTHHE